MLRSLTLGICRKGCQWIPTSDGFRKAHPPGWLENIHSGKDPEQEAAGETELRVVGKRNMTVLGGL